MKHRVELTASAAEEFEAAYLYIAATSPRNAARWRIGLYAACDSLELLPHGCSLAPENEHVNFEVRQKFYGVYRLIFTIAEDRVIILHLRHGARQPLRPEELRPPAP